MNNTKQSRMVTYLFYMFIVGLVLSYFTTNVNFLIIALGIISFISPLIITPEWIVERWNHGSN